VTDILTEKYITFGDPEFQDQAREKTDIAREHFNEMGNQAIHRIDEVLRSKDYKQAELLLTEGLFWREGAYLLEIQMSGKELRSVQREILEMTLTRRDIQSLQENLQLMKEVLKAYVIKGELFQPAWIFIHPSIQISA
jgi:hypothetical protein